MPPVAVASVVEDTDKLQVARLDVLVSQFRVVSASW
jgi:hypothetical protein